MSSNSKDNWNRDPALPIPRNYKTTRSVCCPHCGSIREYNVWANKLGFVSTIVNCKSCEGSIAIQDSGESLLNS